MEANEIDKIIDDPMSVQTDGDQYAIEQYLYYMQRKLEYAVRIQAEAGSETMTKQLRGQIKHTLSQIGTLKWLRSINQQRTVLHENNTA